MDKAESYTLSTCRNFKSGTKEFTLAKFVIGSAAWAVRVRSESRLRMK
jgi:hypothetical protein